MVFLEFFLGKSLVLTPQLPYTLGSWLWPIGLIATFLPERRLKFTEDVTQLRGLNKHLETGTRLHAICSRAAALHIYVPFTTSSSRPAWHTPPLHYLWQASASRGFLQETPKPFWPLNWSSTSHSAVQCADVCHVSCSNLSTHPPHWTQFLGGSASELFLCEFLGPNTGGSKEIHMTWIN